MNVTLFDLDHTLLPIDSDHSWGVYTCTIGWTDAQVFAQRNDAFYAQYQAGRLDVHDYVRFATEAIRQRGRDASLEARADFMRDVIAPVIRPEALELVHDHQRRGDRVAIITATNEFVTRPIADAFGVPELIAVELECDNTTDGAGWLSGEIRGVPSMRDGKIKRCAQWLARQGLSRADVVLRFYSDSMNDLPLLQHCDEPVATNPEPRLRSLAGERGWRILDLFQPSP